MLFCIADKDLKFFGFSPKRFQTSYSITTSQKDENDGNMKHFIFIVSMCPVH